MMPPVPFGARRMLTFVSLPVAVIVGALAAAAPATTSSFADPDPSVAAPLTSGVLDSVVAPVTPRVLDRVVAPVTPRVLDRVVAPVTPRVLDRVVAPVTPSVPPTVVLPVAAAT